MAIVVADVADVFVSITGPCGATGMVLTLPAGFASEDFSAMTDFVLTKFLLEDLVEVEELDELRFVLSDGWGVEGVGDGEFTLDAEGFGLSIYDLNTFVFRSVLLLTLDCRELSGLFGWRWSRSVAGGIDVGCRCKDEFGAALG